MPRGGSLQQLRTIDAIGRAARKRLPRGLFEFIDRGTEDELALTHEAEGDLENAGRYFEQVYAENIDFRDVSQRVKNIAVTR